MSITGEKKGLPTKIGVGVSDIITGLYATISILSALRFRDQSSLGQHLDISLLDSQVSWDIATNIFENVRRLFSKS